MDIKRALRDLIESAGLTQLELQERTGINQGRISRITSPNTPNRPTLSDLLLIEAACGEAPGFLLAAAGLTSIEGTDAGARARVAASRTRTARSS